MSDPLFSPSIRTRRTAFSSRVEAAGVSAYTVYNHMLLPTVFRSVAEDCAHLKSAVQIWDVAAERQVELRGPDAACLLQMTTPRDLSRMDDDQCYYIPMVDAGGGMINDPIAIRLGPDRFWISLADSDMLYYFKGLVAGLGLNVRVFEPDISPLAIQGPRADELVARVFGTEITATRFFRHKTLQIGGKDMIIARSGWSKQGGFEIYLNGSEHGEALWDRLFDAGAGLNVRAGCPNLIERTEAGLLSYGTDITIANTPFEAGLGKYCHLDSTRCLGHEALIAKREPERQIRAVEIAGDPVPACVSPWALTDASGAFAGRVSSAIWSPDFTTNVAAAMIEATHWLAGTELLVDCPDGQRPARVRKTFWI
ncbi:MAG: dimethylsulfoniopropionate demethylase [Rhodobacteraceae bacterium]|nr:dimethylsulfoniopropionate demethylase [Paracoccaceae bacterium]